MVLTVFIAAGLGAHFLSLALCSAYLASKYKYADVGDFTPPVTILKPLRGLNVGDEDNFRTFFQLDYPVYEILFLIHEDAGDDPAIPCIQTLIAQHPRVKARIVRTCARVAVHEKVNNYIEGVEKASYDVICITDADAYVDRDYLSRDVKPLSDPAVGLVTSLQTMNDFRCAATAFEGLPQNFDGLMYFIVSYVMGRINIVYGHSVLFRKEDFYRVNAIHEIKDHPLDDIAIGTAFVDKGGMRVEISPRIVPTRYPHSSWRKVTSHILRWRRLQRAYTPATIALSIYFMIFWGIVTVALSFLVSPQATILGVPLRALGLGFGSAAVVVRFACVFSATLVAGDKKRDLRYIWTLFLYDPFAIYTSIACFFINSFQHAGRTYRIERNRLRRVDEQKSLAARFIAYVRRAAPGSRSRSKHRQSHRRQSH